MLNIRRYWAGMVIAAAIGLESPAQAGTEKEIAVSDVPLKIITAARKKVFAIQFTEAEMIEQDDGRVIYELEGIKDNVTYVVQVDGQGKVLRSGAEDDFEEERRERNLSKLPAAVKEAVEKKMEGIALVDFATETEFGKLVYEVEGIVDGQCFEVEVTPEGTVLETEACD